jgi:hypothetical protein
MIGFRTHREVANRIVFCICGISTRSLGEAMEQKIRVVVLPGGPRYGPNGLPETLRDARKAGWISLKKVLPGHAERKLFSVWRTYGVVPPNITWGQWWNPQEKHTVVLWSAALGSFLHDAFFLRQYATLKGRQQHVSGDYGLARMYAPLRIALWAYRTWYDYPLDLMRASIQYVMEIAEHSSPARFYRGPQQLALAFARPRSGRNITRAQESAVSLMFPDVEDYYPHVRESGVPRTINMKFLRDLETKIRNIDERRRDVISSLRGQRFERAREVVNRVDRKTLERMRSWAHFILLSGFAPMSEQQLSRRAAHHVAAQSKRSWIGMFSYVGGLAEDYTMAALLVLQDPPTFRDVCRNLGLYIGLRILAYEEMKGKTYR